MTPLLEKNVSKTAAVIEEFGILQDIQLIISCDNVRVFYSEKHNIGVIFFLLSLLYQSKKGKKYYYLPKNMFNFFCRIVLDYIYYSLVFTSKRARFY